MPRRGQCTFNEPFLIAAFYAQMYKCAVIFTCTFAFPA